MFRKVVKQLHFNSFYIVVFQQKLTSVTSRSEILQGSVGRILKDQRVLKKKVRKEEVKNAEEGVFYRRRLVD